MDEGEIKATSLGEIIETLGVPGRHYRPCQLGAPVSEMLHESYRTMAAADGISMADEVRRALYRYLNWREGRMKGDK